MAITSNEAIDVNGMQVAYERAGDGPALVLLHGYVSDGPVTWRPQLDGLAGEFTVIAWDAPGAGRSSDPPETFGMADYADCLAAFIAALGLDRPHVAGLSFGGALALALYGRHPDLVGSLTLASAYAGWAGSLGPEATEQRLAQALALAELSGEQLVATLLPTMFAAGTDPRDVEAFGASMLAFHPAGLRAMARASAENLRHVLPTVAVPTLLIYGDRDVRAPLTVAHDLRAAITGSSLVVLPEAGHVCNIEAPDAFNAAVRSFAVA